MGYRVLLNRQDANPLVGAFVLAVSLLVVSRKQGIMKKKMESIFMGGSIEAL